MNRTFLVFASIVFLFSTSLFAGSLDQAMADAVSANSEVSSRAISQLRSKGQAGLDALLEKHRQQINQQLNHEVPDNWIRISTAIDQVAKQKDAHSSGLYWYTNLEKAGKLARRTNRLVLSLRLLGNLDEEYSCANSRFFRAILYSDPQIQQTIRQKYVLHWSSERPAPKITVDFGNGRKLVRTITGNSIHYILKPDGTIVDAVPGLYSPSRFNSAIKIAATQNVSKHGFRRTMYSSTTATKLIAEWESILKEIYPKEDKKITAALAAPLAVAKMITETSLLQTMDIKRRRLHEVTKQKDWKSIAARIPVTFSSNSLKLMRTQTSNLDDAEFDEMISNLTKFVALDTVQNEFRLRTQLHKWLGEKKQRSLDDFNTRVYRELFLTPADDKWLGLYEKDVYYAIRDNGVRQ